MKTKNMIYFGIFVAVLVITDCIAGKEPVKFWIFMAALAVSGSISRKEPERFRKLMTDTLGYTMSLGLILGFLEVLALYGIEICEIPWSLSPLDFMSVVSYLFFFSFISEKWTLPTRQDSSEKKSFSAINPMKWWRC